jgi:long-subunit fatty acid transport protein
MIKHAAPISLTLTFLQATPCFGLGIEYGYHDTEVMARGNAGVASATRASAVYYNPALLGISPEASAYMSSYLLDYNFDYVGPNGSDSIDGVPAVAASAFAMIPLGEDVGLGLGLYSPFGQNNKWSDVSPLRNLALDSEVIFLAGTAAIGFEAAPGLNFGFSLSGVHSEANLRRGLIATGDRFSLEGDGQGWGAGAGFSWEPTEQHRFAGSVRWWSDVEYESEVVTFSPLGSTIVPAQTTLDYPTEWTVGYAWLPCKEWVVEVDVIYTEWSSFDQFITSTPAGNLVEPLLWNDSFKVAAGATRYWESGWWFGFGYWFAETTGPDETFNPRLPDVEFHVLSLGVGYRTDCWAVDFGYQRGYGKSRTITTAPPIPPSGVSANGKYTYSANAFSLGLSYFW